MKILVTGSAGDLGEALMRGLRAGFGGTTHEAVGIDVLASPFTTHVGSIADRGFVAYAMRGIDAVLHVATLHKPHVATHSKQAFIDANVTGTLILLEAAAATQVGAFVFTSTTSSFGDAMAPPPGAPAVWVDEALKPIPKNIYGATKLAAEDLCGLFHRQHGMPCVVLRTSRFFPERDDQKATRDRYAPANAQVNELLNRRVDIEDVLSAKARDELGWRPKHDFASAIAALRAGGDHQSALARQVGVKGYHPNIHPTTHPNRHATTFADGPYPVAQR